jgi:cytoskeletal protein CcmA (bactofilin family)
MFNRGKKDESADMKPGGMPTETPLPLRPILQTPQKPETPPSPAPSYRPELARKAPESPLSPIRPAVSTPSTTSTVATSADSSMSGRDRDHDSKRLIVGRGIVLNGQITSCDMLVVEGKVEATLTETRAMEIAETGVYKGSAEIDEAEISGRFDGNLSVRGRLLIRATGKVTGEVRYGQLEVQCGGELSGNISVVAAKSAAELVASRSETTKMLVEQPGL